MRLIRKTVVTVSAIVALVASSAAFAHIQEFAWNDNGDGTATFYGSSYHAGAEYATSGLVIDGTSFSYTSLTATTDAAFTALLGTLDGSQFIENFSSVDGYGSFTLSSQDMLDLGWPKGDTTPFSFTASVFSSGAQFVDVNGDGTLYTNTISVNIVPEPTTLAIFGVGLAGLGFMRRRRKLARA